MARSLVLGVNGQDGSYVAESLLRRGYEVTGIGRDPTSRYIAASQRFRYHQCDLRDAEALVRIVREIAPVSAFHMAAVHGASGFGYEPVWRDMMAVNVLALHVLLEHARVADRAMHIVYAGSAKVFPAPLSGIIDQTTPMRATCLYGIGKLAARELMARYRALHQIASTNLILFNHESPRRGPEYLVPLIARTIVHAKTDPGYRASVNTLDFRADWSSASELMDIAVDIAERCQTPEFVLGSGTTWHGREAAERLFANYGLDSRRHIVEMQTGSDPGPEFRVSLQLLEQEIGRRPVKTLPEIVDELVACG